MQTVGLIEILFLNLGMFLLRFLVVAFNFSGKF